MKYILIFCILVLGFTSCKTLKEYEKVNINDPDMKLADNSVDRFKTNFHVYREGASGASGGKTGGGCGCN